MTESERLQKIGELIRTQDNVGTSDPLFLVQEKNRLYGIDPDYTYDTVWISSAGDCEEADEDEAKRLNELKDRGETDTDWTLTGYVDQWRFVTACFTKKGCQDYIDANRHNLCEPRIYVASAYRNEELITLREFLSKLS